MKVASWLHYGLAGRKVVALGILTGLGTGALVAALTAGALGSSSEGLAAIIGAIVAYFVVSAPKRMLEASSFSQSKEAPALAAMASANLEASHSRARTLLQMDSTNPEIRAALVGVRRGILLGFPLEPTVRDAGAKLASYSAASVLRGVASLPAQSLVEGGEETAGGIRSSQLGEESKVPIFMTVAFFAPIMLVLYAVMSHVGDPRSLAELVGLEIVILEITFYFTSTERKRLG